VTGLRARAEALSVLAADERLHGDDRCRYRGKAEGIMLAADAFEGTDERCAFCGLVANAFGRGPLIQPPHYRAGVLMHRVCYEDTFTGGLD
jgi:hypothetical protein